MGRRAGGGPTPAGVLPPMLPVLPRMVRDWVMVGVFRVAFFAYSDSF